MDNRSMLNLAGNQSSAQPRQQSINEEAGLPENWIPSNQKPIIPSIPQAPGDASDRYLTGTLPPGYQHDVSFVGTQYKTSVAPSLSLMPLGIQGNPVTNAAIQSTAIVAAAVTAVSGPSSITFTAPIEAIITGSPGNKINWAWATEPGGTVFAGPLTNVGGFDAAFGTSGSSGNPTVPLGGKTISITGGAASADPSWALYAGMSTNAAFDVDPVGWTALPNHSAGNPQMYKAIPSGATSVTVGSTITPLATNGSYATTMSYFAGPVPTFVQSASNSLSSVGTPFTIPLVATSAGNAILVLIRTVFIPQNNVEGTTPIGFSITDSQGLTPYLLQTQGQNAPYGTFSGAGSRYDVYMLSGTSAAAETITINVYATFDPVFGYPSIQCFATAIEITTTTLPSGIPRFRTLPATNLSVANLLGLLPTFYGGTGANLAFTGGANQVVQQPVTGGPFTVGQLSVANLSTLTIGTGTKIFMATTVTGSGTVGVLGTSPSIATPTFTGLASGATLALTGKFTKYNNINIVSNGVPSEYATVDNAAATANIGSTALYAVPATGAGMYRVSYYLTVNRVATTSSTLPDFQIQWTDPDNSTVQTLLAVSGTPSTNTLTTTFQGSFKIYVKLSTNINYQVGVTTVYASVGATTMQYSLRVKLEAL